MTPETSLEPKAPISHPTLVPAPQDASPSPIPLALSAWGMDGPENDGSSARIVYVLAQQTEPAEASANAEDEGHEATGAEAQGVGAHGADEPEEYEFQMPEELPNFHSVLTLLVPKKQGEHQEEHEGFHMPFVEPNPNWWVNPIFSFFYAALFVVVVSRVFARKSLKSPGRAQVALEALFGGLMDFFGEVVGKENARKYVPFVGSLWIFILLNNWAGLIPLFKSPTAHFETTFALGICTFCYVNFQGIKAGGIRHYLWHLCGSPYNTVGWVFAPMLFLLELLGTFIKPISLSLRLFGNVFGEDTLLATFLGLGLLIVGTMFDTPTPLLGIPLHFPFLFLATLTSLIQATVFALLAAVYISLLLPHGDHGEAKEHAH